jgi:hypothetical protein
MDAYFNSTFSYLMLYYGAFVAFYIVFRSAYNIIEVISMSHTNTFDVEKFPHLYYIRKLRIYILLLTSIAAPFFLFAMFDQYPPFIPFKKSMSPDVLDVRTQALVSEAKRIRKALSDVEDLTIKEIHNELARTLDFIEKLQRESVYQQETIERLNQQITDTKEKAIDVERTANEVEAITAPQLEAVRSLITEDAKRESRKSFWFGVVLSFLVGVPASMIGGWLLRRTIRIPLPQKPNVVDDT